MLIRMNGGREKLDGVAPSGIEAMLGEVRSRRALRSSGARRSPLSIAASCATIAILTLALGSCSRLLGWGLLLWSVDDPQIASGTVLPVYIRSNIDGVWVVGVPNAQKGGKKKIELPLWQLELYGSKRKAAAAAKQFAEFASVYAEASQDGLPIRVEPDNGARRTYRLKQGEIVKVLSRAQGSPAMSGDTPLPGEWLKVLTNDGSTGYCFSYRLKLFDHTGGALAASTTEDKIAEDPRLDLVLSRSWSPESYKEMIDTRRIDLARFSDSWGFFPGQDLGIVRISLPNLELSYPYTSITKVDDDVWRFEGSPVQVTLRSDSVLAVQYPDSGGAQRTVLFVALNGDVKDLIAQETERRNTLLEAIRKRGPAFRSENYGLLTFGAEGAFTWTNFDLLVPSIVGADARPSGTAEMKLFLDDKLQPSYDGAISLRFDGAASSTSVDFLYILEPNGLRLEYVPPSSLDGVLVKRRASAPTVIFFTRAER